MEAIYKVGDIIYYPPVYIYVPHTVLLTCISSFIIIFCVVLRVICQTINGTQLSSEDLPGINIP